MGFDNPNMEDNQGVSDFDVVNFLIPSIISSACLIFSLVNSSRRD